VAFHASQTSPIAQTRVAFTGKAMSVVFEGAETPQAYLKKTLAFIIGYHQLNINVHDSNNKERNIN
jgi:hypothetical protein